MRPADSSKTDGPPEPSPDGPPVDGSISDLSREQANLAYTAARGFMGPRISAFIAFFLPGSSMPFDRMAFAGALAMAVAAVPLAMKGPAAVFYLIPCLAPVLFFGWLWRSRILGVLAIILALASVGEGYGLIAYWRAQEAGQKQRMEAAAVEAKRLKAEQEAAARKAEEEKAERAARAVIEQAEAEKRAREQEARRADQEFERTQALREKERAAAAQKRAEEAALARKRADDEEARKRAAAEAERARQAALDKRAEQREAAKAVYAQKALVLTESATALRLLEEKIRSEKTFMDTQQLVLERENSPKPPTDAELERARKQFNEAKLSLQRLQADLPKLKSAAEQAAKEKREAETVLDELSK